MTVLQVRIDNELKNQATAIYNELGMDLSTAIRMFLKKSVMIGGIPFETKIDRLRKFIENKLDDYNTELLINKRYFPSSKTCSRCGNINKDLKLSTRVYRCKNCGLIINRDVNAAINLVQNVGRVTSEFTPLDLNTLINDAKVSNIKVLKIEEGK